MFYKLHTFQQKSWGHRFSYFEFENIYYKIPFPILKGKCMSGNIQRAETS